MSSFFSWYLSSSSSMLFSYQWSCSIQLSTWLVLLIPEPFPLLFLVFLAKLLFLFVAVGLQLFAFTDQIFMKNSILLQVTLLGTLHECFSLISLMKIWDQLNSWKGYQFFGGAMYKANRTRSWLYTWNAYISRHRYFERRNRNNIYWQTWIYCFN